MQRTVNILYYPYMSDGCECACTLTGNEDDIHFIFEFAENCGYFANIDTFGKESINEYIVVEIIKNKE